MLGEQLPRVSSYPAYVTSAGVEAIECSKMAGLIPDPWQEHVAHHGLGEKANGKWSAFELVGCVPRQNGKGGIIEMLELAGLFVFGEKLIIYSAHLFDTAKESMRRLLELIESTQDFDRRVQRVSRSHGEEGIELKGGQRIRFRTRTKGGGRGLTGDRVILDEAMFLPESSIAALMPTMSARPNPQACYFGSAVDQLSQDDGIVFARLRERALAGGDASLAYFEWSVECDSPEVATPAMLADRAAWAQANPALGIRISPEHVENEMRSMDARTFAVERLGIGDWPSADGELSVIDMALWGDLADEASVVLDPICLAFDVTPDRGRAAIGCAGRRKDGRWHVEVIDARRGTGWLVKRTVELDAKHRPGAIVCDARGPAASLVHELEQAGVRVTTTSGAENAAGCGLLFDAVQQKRLRHMGQDELTLAVRGAAQRPLGDAWAWARKLSTTDISPLVCVTLAMWGAETLQGRSVYEDRGLLVMGKQEGPKAEAVPIG